MLEPRLVPVRRCTARRSRSDAGARQTGPSTQGDTGVKKLMVVVAAVGAGFALWRKVEADKAEQALWAEVTDPVK